ncbi:MAG: helix-turn-helix transcriptional regulator [Rhodospirillaceae bacterium]
MLTHGDVWRAIDRLAREHGLSASGLARRAGLDPTTFNKSKRVTREGKNRWPSTESVAKVLAATGATMNEFVSYIGDGAGAGVYRNIPLIGFAQAGSSGYFDDAGYPAGGSWDEIPFPSFSDPHAYALEISADSMAPVLRDGDIVIVSPEANIRRGDRVVVKTKAGEILAKVLLRQTASRIELQSLNPLHEDRVLAVEEIEWLARVIWASQ